MFDSYAAYLAQVGDRPIRVGRIDGRWRLAVKGTGWQLYDDHLACCDDIAGESERARLRSWAAELLGVRLVELHRDSRAPGAFMVTVEA